jgi:CRP-like cAMP-binding protein
MGKQNNARNFRFSRGQVLYRYDDSIDKLSIFYIYRGLVELHYKLNNDREFTVKIPAGGFVGLVEPLAGEEIRITEVVFLEDSTISAWNEELFLTDVSIIPELGIKCIGFLSSMLRTINRKIQETGEN